MIVFTNGCFDILHPGHIDLLQRARSLGDRLIVGLNSDESVRRIKGPDRPYFDQNERAAMLLALESVDEVKIFYESTPERLIREITPDVIVKGGDWAEDEILGGETVKAYGGRVISLPLKSDYSSSSVVDRIRSVGHEPGRPNGVSDPFDEHLDVITAVKDKLIPTISESAELIVRTINAGRKVLIFGNGGSAADAQHFAAELVGRYEAERRALPAIALTTDTSALTAIANDYDFEQVFARQIQALARPGDCVVAISTSGGSPNVIAGVLAARSAGCGLIGFTGANGRKLAGLCDISIHVPSTRTARIQEAHITIIHAICERVEARLFFPNSE